MDFEKSQQKKLEKETKRNQTTLAQERKKQLQFAKAVMDERKLLLLELNETKQRAEELEHFVLAERVKLREAAKAVAYERKRSATMEAEMERQASEFDIEGEQLRAKLNREENRTRELRGEVEAAIKRIEALEKTGSSSASTVGPTPGNKVQTNGPVNNKQGSSSTGSPKTVTVNGSIREARDRLTKASSRSPLPSVKPSKIYTVKGFQSPKAATTTATGKGDKTESSSSGSDELPSPLSPNTGLAKSITGPTSTAGKKPKPSASKPSLTGKHSADLESVVSKTRSPRSSPSPSTGLHRTNSGGRTLGSASSLDKLTKTGKSSLSPASSLDRLTKSASLDKLSKSSSLDKLSKIGSDSPPSQRNSKIPASISGSTSAFQRGSSASPTRKSFNGGERTTSEPGRLNRVNSPSTPLNSKSNVNSSSTNGLSRPTALSNSKSDSTRSSFRKIPVPGWPLSGGSPSTSPTKPVSTKASSWRKTPSSTNSNATQPGNKATSPPSKTSAPSTNGLSPHGKGSPPASSSPAQSPQSNGQLTNKKPLISPRGTPPPIPPNKPTLPQKSNATTPVTSSPSSAMSITSPILSNSSHQSLPKSDTNQNTTFPSSPSSSPNNSLGRKTELSLVEARKQFYNNKLGHSGGGGGSSTNTSNVRHPLDNYHLVCANTNANNSNHAEVGNKTMCNANEAEPTCCGPLIDNSPIANAPSQVGCDESLSHAAEGAPISRGQTPNQFDTSLHAGRFLPAAKGKKTTKTRKVKRKTKTCGTKC